MSIVLPPDVYWSFDREEQLAVLYARRSEINTLIFSLHRLLSFLLSYPYPLPSTCKSYKTWRAD